MKYQIEYRVTLPIISSPVEAGSEEEALSIWREQRRNTARIDPDSVKVVPADPDWPEFSNIEREER